MQVTQKPTEPVVPPENQVSKVVENLRQDKSMAQVSMQRKVSAEALEKLIAGLKEDLHSQANVIRLTTTYRQTLINPVHDHTAEDALGVLSGSIVDMRV